MARQAQRGVVRLSALEYDVPESRWTIVQSIHSKAHAAGMVTIAERVESDAIIGRRNRMCVDYLQGFCVSMSEPLPNGMNGAVAVQSQRCLSLCPAPGRRG